VTSDRNPSAAWDDAEWRKNSLSEKTPFKLKIIAVAVAATVFTLDILLPLGIAGGVPYVGLILVGWWLPKRRTIIFLAIISSLLTVIGYLFSPEGGTHWVVLTNRAYALLAIWATATTLWLAKRDRSRVILKEAALKFAIKKAESADVAKGEFLANMSHELRTPLNAIIGFSQMLGMESFGSLGSGQNKEYVKIINNSGSHLSKIIGDILDLSKIDSGAESLYEEKNDVGEIVNECLEMLSERAEKKRLIFHADIEPNIPSLQADRLKVKQILLNLLSNAIKFTPEDGEVKVIVNLSDQRSILFKVQDTGVGISYADMEKVFEPFIQTGNTITRSHEGAGLGLTISRKLMKIHGGTLEMKSEFGHGTVVTAEFPAHRTVQS
jgi:signal transduction histidine kinase